jgi:regulatory protein
MIKIVEIIAKRNSRYQLNILKEDKPVKHILSEITMFKYDLFRPKEITLKQYNDIIKTAEYDLLFIKALNFISYQMRTISEVKKNLRKSTEDEKTINNIIKELKEKKYLNDDKYVLEYVTQKIEFDLVGPRYIKEKLIGKGIHFDLIDSHLVKYKDEDQYDKVYQLIVNATKFPIKKPYNKAYMSLKSKLVNKGFSMNIVQSALISNKELIENAVEEDDLLIKDFEKLLKKYDKNEYEDKNKIIKSLMSKGYNYQLIKKLFE